MKRKHIYRAYPPRFTIEVHGQRATEDSHVKVEFTGVNKPLCSEVFLPLPIQPPVHKEITGIVRTTLPVMFTWHLQILSFYIVFITGKPEETHQQV